MPETTKEQEKAHADLRAEIAQMRGTMEANQKNFESTTSRLQSELTDARKEPAEETKSYTVQELQVMVDDGRISEGTRDGILSQQTRDQTRNEIKTEMREEMASMRQSQQIDGEIAKYTDSNADVMKEGTELRGRVEEEYQFLVSHGEPVGKFTELKSLRAVMGPSDRIRETTAERRPTHSDEGGSGAGDSDRGGSKEGGVPGPLQKDPKLKFHYDGLIATGVYSGYDDPDLVKEMKYVRPRR